MANVYSLAAYRESGRKTPVDSSCFETSIGSSSIENYVLGMLAAGNKPPDFGMYEADLILDLVEPLSTGFPLIDQKFYYKLFQEMLQPDGSKDREIPRQEELRAWQASNWSLIPGFDFKSAYDKFLVPVRDNPAVYQSRFAPATATETMKVVPPRFRTAEAIFLLCLRLFRWQYLEQFGK